MSLYKYEKVLNDVTTMSNSGIYSITNLVNGKKYIGQTVNFNIRKIAHFSKLRSNNHYNKYLQNSFNKYGEENFKFEIVHQCHINQLDELEQHYILINDSMNPKFGYNLESGGHENKKLSEETRKTISESLKGEKNPFYGKHHSEETRRKISENHKGRKLSQEHRAKISKGNKGKLVSEETRKRMSEAQSGENHPFYGKHLSKEHRKKLSESHKGEKNHFYGKKHSKESLSKISENHADVSGTSNPAAKYTLWNINNCQYRKYIMLKGGKRTPNPCVCFTFKFKGKELPIGVFYEFVSPTIISNIIENEIKKEN